MQLPGKAGLLQARCDDSVPEHRVICTHFFCGNVAVDDMQMGVPQTVISRAELSLSTADNFLATAPPPTRWWPSIELLGTVSKTTQFSAAVHTMNKEHYGKVLVQVDVRPRP